MFHHHLGLIRPLLLQSAGLLLTIFRNSANAVKCTYNPYGWVLSDMSVQVSNKSAQWPTLLTGGGVEGFPYTLSIFFCVSRLHLPATDVVFVIPEKVKVQEKKQLL